MFCSWPAGIAFIFLVLKSEWKTRRTRATARRPWAVGAWQRVSSIRSSRCRFFFSTQFLLLGCLDFDYPNTDPAQTLRQLEKAANESLLHLLDCDGSQVLQEVEGNGDCFLRSVVSRRGLVVFV